MYFIYLLNINFLKNVSYLPLTTLSWRCWCDVRGEADLFFESREQKTENEWCKLICIRLKREVVPMVHHNNWVLPIANIITLQPKEYQAQSSTEEGGIMAWRSSGNNNSEMVDKLTRKQPIMCHSMSLMSCYTPFVALFCICNAFLCILLLADCLQIGSTPSIWVADWPALWLWWLEKHRRWCIILVIVLRRTVRMNRPKHPKVNHASIQV